MCCLIADLFPKRRNAQNRFPLYGFGAILGVFFRYERLCFDGGILYRQPFKSRCLSLPGNKKAPYCYDAFVLLGRWSKGTLFNYLLYFFFLLTTVVPMAAPLLTNSRAIHSARLLVSPVWGSLESSFSFAVTVSAFSTASCSAYFVAGVLGIPPVHYVEERGEVVILRLVTVHAVIDCNKAYLLLGEQNLGIKADLKIVSAETAHILDDNCADFPGFGFCKHCLKSGTIEVTPCVTVIFQKIVCKKFVILKIHINCNLCYSIEK